MTSHFTGTMYCFIVCLSCPLVLRDISRTPMAQYSLFVLKVPLNTNQPINPFICLKFLTSNQFSKSSFVLL